MSRKIHGFSVGVRGVDGKSIPGVSQFRGSAGMGQTVWGWCPGAEHSHCPRAFLVSQGILCIPEHSWCLGAEHPFNPRTFPVSQDIPFFPRASLVSQSIPSVLEQSIPGIPEHSQCPRPGLERNPNVIEVPQCIPSVKFPKDFPLPMPRKSCFGVFFWDGEQGRRNY